MRNIIVTATNGTVKKPVLVVKATSKKVIFKPIVKILSSRTAILECIESK